MVTLRDFAKAYTPPQTKNIADLEEVNVDVDIKAAVGKDGEGEDFSYSYIEVNGEKYRVPNSVVAQLKDVIETRPELKKFKVKKSGAGMQTRYSVIAF